MRLCIKQTNKPTDYYTRGRPRAPRVTNKQTNRLLYPWPPTRSPAGSSIGMPCCKCNRTGGCACVKACTPTKLGTCLNPTSKLVTQNTINEKIPTPLPTTCADHNLEEPELDVEVNTHQFGVVKMARQSQAL